MGNTTSSQVQSCLESAVGQANVAFNGSALYETAHVKPYNLDIPVTPVAVTYPTTADEVAAIVKCAADNDLKVQSRSGGHSYANYGIGGQNGAIVVDLSNFQQFSMDEVTWQATIGSGTLLGDITKRLHNNGKRAIAHGTSPQIGIGGHATIGGLGPTSRMWGMALDHVEEVEVVLANSSIVRASETQNSDLFFAIKGAGAGFGIVTEFKFRTEAEPGAAVLYTFTIQGGSVAEKANAFKMWQSLVSDPTLSRKFASNFILTEQLGAIITGTFFGSQAEYDSLDISSRLPSSASANVTVIDDWLGLVAHWAGDVLQSATGGISAHFYSKSLVYRENDLLPDDAVDELFEYIDKADKGGAIWFIIWDLEGGAISDVAADATSYGHRDALFCHQSYGVSLQGNVKNTTHAFLTEVNNKAAAALKDHEQGAYAGYVDPELGPDSATAYWGDNVDKLQRIKEDVDPNDVFHNPQSIKPAK